jgi:hypothetical protein
MAAVIKGETYVFGIDSGAVTNAVLTSINFNSEFANTGQVLNEDGQIVHERMDDLQTTGSASMQFTASNTMDLTDVGNVDQFTYDGVTYYITEITKTSTNNGFAEMSFNFEYVDHTSNAAETPA